MFCKIHSGTIRGIEMLPVEIEVDVSPGLPSLDMVGLLSSEVREARERVRTAVKNMGETIPPKRITINLSPAGVRKDGSGFDLPIGIGILTAIGVVSPVYDMNRTVVVGELSLDGRLRGIRGALAIAASAKEKGYERIILPGENAGEAAVVEGIDVIAADSLRDCADILNGLKKVKPEKNIVNLPPEDLQDAGQKEDFSDVNGQEVLKRAAVIAAAGRHNVLFIGPPGSGKTMVASRIATILPAPDLGECIEITKIHSIAGELKGESFITKRPFRSPHHTITARAMAGGGLNVRPGEITLAHRGVLFLDEMAEYKREALEVLRQPMESKRLVITRTSGVYEFPADFMLVAAANPCRCGYYPDRSRCRCTEREVNNYIGRISGPLLSRIDIMISSPVMNVGELQKKVIRETSLDLRKKVEAVRLIQSERYKGTDISFNSDLSPGDIKKYCYLGEEQKKFLRDVLQVISVSTRTYYKIIKVSRTIADLEGAVNIEKRHLAEAAGYRPELEKG